MEFTNQLCQSLRQRIGSDRFDLWFRDIGIAAVNEQVTVSASTSFQLERIRKNFQKSIQTAARDAGLSESVTLAFRVVSQDQLSTIRGQDSAAPDASTKPAPIPGLKRPTTAAHSLIPDVVATDSPGSAAPPSATSPKQVVLPNQAAPRRLRAASANTRGRRFRTMATFVAGECNQIARTSAEMVAQQPGDITPLVIHGPSGVGKSHLIEAIWCDAKKRSRKASVLYLSAEQYTTYFLDALRGGSGLPAFRRKYRHADILMIDDIQFFAGKQATLVELAYTIDELARQNRQLILTANLPPSQLTKLGPEIVHRLSGGLVCKMKPIDAQTMENISRQWAQEKGIPLSDDLHRLLADKMQGDARQLSGVLNRLWATHRATGQPVSAQLVTEILFELVPSAKKIIRLQDVRSVVCEMFAIDANDLATAKRSRTISAPRMLAMWLARRHTAAGLHEISQFFGRRSHSSAVTANSTVESWLAQGRRIEINGRECDVRDVVGQIEAGLKAG